MSDSCKVCGKTSSLMNCKRCKSVAYCSADCQRQDWKNNKPICQREEFAGAPCDCCGTTEDVDRGIACGSILCKACKEQHLTRDMISGKVVGLEPCPQCNTKRREFGRFSDRKKLEKLMKESPRDPRLVHWLVCLGNLFETFDDTRRGVQKAKENFLRAGELGYGEGFTRIAETYIKEGNWDEARRFYRMGANRM
jgi:MYND finger